MGFDLDTALDAALDLGASDLHLKVPSAPHVRIEGELQRLDGFDTLTTDDLAVVRDRVLRSETKRREFRERGATDLSYFTDRSRFRVAAFSQRSSASFVFRAIPGAPDPDEYGIPQTVLDWSSLQRGLVVVSGPTGQGKSTTTAILLNRINSSRACHIVTIEDPIEFLHTDRRALISQREIGLDASSMSEALRSALRQDPDVILIGEVRDEETALTAARAAETGHLVICTMHTPDAGETVQRFLDLLGPGNSSLARQMLAATLVGVCCQRLVPGRDGHRVLSTEVLVSSSRVRDLIADSGGQLELHSAIAEGEYYGMHTFHQSLAALVAAGQVSESEALGAATNAHDLKLMLVSSDQRM